MPFKPMSKGDFERWVRREGYFVRRTSREWEIVNYLGERICSFTVNHGKGKKREVKACYVQGFARALQRLQEMQDE